MSDVNYKCKTCGMAVVVLPDATMIRPCAADCNEVVVADVKVVVYSKAKVNGEDQGTD